MTTIQMRKIARARLKDADALLQQGLYDGAVYLCGYSIELSLKVRMCMALKWSEFPPADLKGHDCRTIKTHNLSVLLTLSGAAAIIKGRHMADWSDVADWNAEKRYAPIGTAKKSEAKVMIASAERLLKVLL